MGQGRIIFRRQVIAFSLLHVAYTRGRQDVSTKAVGIERHLGIELKVALGHDDNGKNVARRCDDNVTAGRISCLLAFCVFFLALLRVCIWRVLFHLFEKHTIFFSTVG